jgi:threonine synthase
MLELARGEGLFASTEAAATVAGLRHLLDSGVLDRDAEIVLFLTGSGLTTADTVAVNRPTLDPDDVEGCSRVIEADGSGEGEGPSRSKWFENCSN